MFNEKRRGQLSVGWDEVVKKIVNFLKTGDFPFQPIVVSFYQNLFSVCS